jgi:hypothetical protein
MIKLTATKFCKIINKFFTKDSDNSRKPRAEKSAAVTSAVTALIENGQVNLANLAKFNPNTTTIKYSSLEQNSRRLLDNTGITAEKYAKTIVYEILNIQHLEIAIDRTNWKDGSTDINYFVLSVIWNDIAIPIYWILLDNNGGSSNDSQRIQLIQWVVDVFGADAITNIYADREFPSLKFLTYLINDNSCCKAYQELNEYDTYNFNKIIANYKTTQPFEIPKTKLEFLEIQQQYTIIDTKTTCFLIQQLQTDNFRVYSLCDNTNYDKIVQQYKAQYKHFHLDSIALSQLFSGYNVRGSLNFVQRCKSSTIVSYGKKNISLALLYKDLNKRKSKTDMANSIRRAFGNRVYISASLNDRNEYMFIVSNQYHTNPFATYMRRWNIEMMFGKFKTLGFNLESTHLINPNRLANLLQLISIAYVCCCKLGYLINKIQLIKIKKFKLDNDSIDERPQFSIFKLGFYLLKNFINNHLFNGAAMDKLLHKILDSDTDKPMLNKRSSVFKLLINF